MSEVETQASPAQQLEFLINEVQDALCVLDRMKLTDYFDAVERGETIALAILAIHDHLRPALHILGGFSKAGDIERSRPQPPSRRKGADTDRALLRGLSEREAIVADAATRLAYDRAGDWLSHKQAKSEQFPGGDLVHAKGRAAAYQNAAQELYVWAYQHGEAP